MAGSNGQFEQHNSTAAGHNAQFSGISRLKPRCFSLFDAHCDTLTEFGAGGQTLYDAPTHFNVKKQLAYGQYLQVADIWVDSKKHDVDARVENYIDEFYNQLDILKKLGSAGTAEYPEGFDVALIRSSEDIKEFYGEIDGRESAGSAAKKPKAGFLLGIEGGECIDGDAAAFYGGETGSGQFCTLKKLYRLGVRLITITWNTPNKMSDTNATANPSPGLTEFGRAAIKEMNRLGIMIDLSHISDAGFRDVIELSGKPVIASHSDSRTLCPHPRNLTDDMFKALIKKGGVAGINFCTGFLGGSADLAQIIRHIEHFASLGGIKNIGLGSDFDGISELPGGIEGAQSMYKIIDALLKLNYTEEQAEGIASGNFRRVFEEVLPPVEMLKNGKKLTPEEA